MRKNCIRISHSQGVGANQMRERSYANAPSGVSDSESKLNQCHLNPISFPWVRAQFCPTTHGEHRQRKYILVLKDFTHKTKKEEIVPLKDKLQLGGEAEVA